MSELHGVNPEAAVGAIRARAERFKAGDRSPDGRKLALVVEGGALRGVCSAGGVVALEHLGFTDLFDHVYGTSAGVMNASYFLAGQARLGIRVYYEDMNRREIVNPWRLWNILDLDRLFQQAILGDKRLRLDAVLSSRGTLFEAQALGTEAALLAALRAATAVPFLYRRPTLVDGRRCLDGGLVNSFPVADALAAGCTDVLVLLTRPHGYRRPRAGRFMRWLFNRLHARGNPRLARAYARRHEEDAAIRDLAFGRAPATHGANVATICTDDGEVVGRMTTDRSLLLAAARAFGRKTLRILGADPHGWDVD